ncbi:intraflagellar transport protein 88 homolog isoform X2 [Paramacrobiotus metropolitanus]|uniref:intraflagellar transport protein 88 homolog isoform X2 n=1 Tax=Paramacrobiotus metropolitanus TaxID=2943436 RepID=UPI0024460B84|nr:intraflagellar transport protein 88 homolog isoform X2 [Paramacrobiotus metropolitanus]
MSTKSSLNVQDDYDDLYEGYEDASLFSTEKDLLEDAVLQRSIQSSYGERRKSGSAMPSRTATASGSRLGVQTGRTIARPTSTARLSAGSRNDFRPASSIRGVGYSAKSNRSSASSGMGSPSGRHSSATPILVPPLDPADDDIPSKSALSRFRRLEQDIRSLLDEAVLLAARNLYPQALEKMKQMDKLRRSLQDLPEWNPKDKNALINPLLFKINWYYAEILAMNHKFNEAIKIYTELYTSTSKDEQTFVLSRIALIHRRRGEYEQALHIIHKLLDDLSGDGNADKIEMLHQAASCYALMNRWDTAYKYCQMILQDADSPKAAFNSLVCLVATKAEAKKIENAFVRLVEIRPKELDRTPTSIPDEYREIIENDSLRVWENTYKAQCEKYIRTAAQLVANLDEDVVAGYEWCISQVKSSAWPDLIVALEMAKAWTYMKQNQFNKTIEILTSQNNNFEDNRLLSQSCTVLTFLHFNLDDMKQANEYALKAYQADKFNVKACTNMGCMEYANGDFTAALQYFQEALVLTSSDFWASYYAGLTLSALGSHQDALAVFLKLNAAHRQRPTVLYQISQQYELLDEPVEAFNWLQQVFTLHPHEPFVLEHLGALADKLGDKGAALWYYNESYRIYPANFSVLNWLGRFFVASQFPEKAIKFFELAEKLDSSVPKWSLLVAGAMRRAGHLTDAYNKYVEIHEAFADDMDCLKILIRICQETHAPSSEIQKYQKELDLLRRTRPAEVASSSRAQTAMRGAALTDTVGIISERLSTARKSPLPQSPAATPAGSAISLGRVGSVTAGLALDADDLEQFNVRPGTAKRLPSRAGPPVATDETDLNVDDILPGLKR